MTGITGKRDRRDSFDAVVNQVCNMATNGLATRLAGNHGLSIQKISWEDNARSKKSCLGPNISDMTLEVEGRRVPVIRHPNYADLTWDVETAKIPLVAGNEMGGPTYEVTLEEYLRNFRSYLHNPNAWPGGRRSLLADRDTHVVMSSQACFLPVAEGDESQFNVCLYNYQSRPKHPAVLVIVATSEGTSAQIVDSRRGQKLYFNKNGEKASFIAQRLKDNRIERGVKTDGMMSAEEKEKNMVMVIQVPLVQATVTRKAFSGGPIMQCSIGGGLLPRCAAVHNCRGRVDLERFARPDVDEAIIKVGASEGRFEEIGNVAIERDERYPVRVTLQYYKATSNGRVSSEIIAGIARQLQMSQQYASSIGSLVVGNSDRVTEPDLPSEEVTAPAWWLSFWHTYKSNFPHHGEASARRRAFCNGRYLHCTMGEAEVHLFRVLSNDGLAPIRQPRPRWAANLA